MATPQQKVSDILKANLSKEGVNVSFEYFPPRTEKGEEALYTRLAEKFKAQGPVFIDFTWGAGGTTSEKTTELCANCMERFGLVVNMHLTCTNMPKGKVNDALEFCKSKGITNIVALRGDPPAGQEWKASEDGFTCALDLVKYIRANYGDYFSLAVAGYPEGHPDNIDPETGKCSEEKMVAELDYLKAKIDAGGEYIITQLFYDVDVFLKFVDRCRAHGITCPILPGMLPMLNYGGFTRMIGLCKTYIPAEVKAKTEELKEDDAAFKQYGIQLCTQMCDTLRQKGVKHFHFYTLNLDESTLAIMKNLGINKE